jgi:hypothetical protein
MADPFPSPYANLLADDFFVNKALDQARSETATTFPGLPMPALSLVAVKENAGAFEFLHAGMQYGDMFYSGSLPKVGAMYAAFELRRAANLLPTVPAGTPASAAFANLRSEFDDVINTASALISAAPGVSREMRIPKYESIFAAVPLVDGGFSFEFNAAFSNNMRKMIVESDNASAGACVKALGYSCLNGALERGGFFYTPSKSGIWLAGTYGGGWTPVRVPCLNDVDTAQGMTCFDTANLYAHLVQGSLGHPFTDSSTKMLDLLADAATTDPSFIDWQRRTDQQGRRVISDKRYTVTHTKIGIGWRTAAPNEKESERGTGQISEVLYKS